MEKRPCISVGQLFAMLFVSRMVVTMTYGTLLIGSSDIWDHLISSIISFALTFLMVIPIYKLFSMDKTMNVFDNLRDLMGKIGYIFISIYIIYFLDFPYKQRQVIFVFPRMAFLTSYGNL